MGLPRALRVAVQAKRGARRTLEERVVHADQ
jgi:hypothetical protein